MISDIVDAPVVVLVLIVFAFALDEVRAERRRSRAQRASSSTGSALEARVPVDDARAARTNHEGGSTG